MTKNRLEAFSDGVIAIIITIMVLELKVPHGTTWHDLGHLWPVFLSYVVSFVNLGIYWGNHHHLLHTIKDVKGGLLWANMNLLFWLSLIPFATAWMGENEFAQNTVIAYSILANLCGFAYFLLLVSIKKSNPNNQELHDIIDKQGKKGILSLVLYSLAIAASFYDKRLAGIFIVMVSIMWLMPDRNIEKKLGN